MRVQPRLVIFDAFPWPVEVVLRKALRKAQGPRSLDNMAVVGHVDEPGKQLFPAIHKFSVFWRVAPDAAELQGRGPIGQRSGGCQSESSTPVFVV